MINFYKYVILLIAILFVFSTANSQIIFENAFSGGKGYAVIATSDSGYAITGSNTRSLLLIKTNSTGNLLWEKHFGDSTGLHPEHDGFDILQMPDRGFIVCGRGRPFNSNVLPILSGLIQLVI
jgi:hypothetical protein